MNLVYYVWRAHLVFALWFGFYAFRAASSSLTAVGLSSQCWPKDIELFADLGCARNGLTYLVAKHDPPISSGNVVPVIGANSADETSPWTYVPVCTSVLEKLGTELCVFTSTEFAAGRGISIITIPQLAEKLATSFIRRSPTIDGLSHSSRFGITSETQSKGRCAVAKQDFQRGDEVASNLPILLQHHSVNELSWLEREEVLRVAISQLPFSTQQLLGRLTAEPARDEFFLSGIMYNHAGFAINITDHKHHGLYPEMAFFNHDCAPKLVLPHCPVVSS